MGPRGAATLLRRYGSLEKALAAGCFAAQAQMLRLYLSIATMDKSAPLPPLRNQKPNWSKAAALARDWQLNRLADRLEVMARAAAKLRRTH
jgi:DNA polymerase-1